MRRVIDFWEEHCVECGEPDCYRSCPKYRPSRTGRCGRLAGGRFLEWGKLELLWHGGLADGWIAACVRVLNAALEPVARMCGPCVYRVFRSVRWRAGKALAWHRTPPTVWRVAVETERAERLRLVLRDRDLKVLGEWQLASERVARRSTPTGENEIALPPIEEGALFSIYPEGATASGRIRFLRNELIQLPTPNPQLSTPNPQPSTPNPQPSTPNPQPSTLNPQHSTLKCVAWDLDGVIWDGTLGEGEEVRLRPGVMEAIRALDSVGIVSSLCSKNDADVALAKLKELGIEEWFVFPQINWGPKSESLANLAKEMNIGLDSMAFVDDRAENRAEVKVNCPGARVWDEKECLDRSREETENCRRVCGTGGLGARRRLMYREEMARRGAARSFAGDAAAFAAASGLSFELLPVEGERIGRCLELVRRTNQLNLTGRRYDAAAFAGLLADATCRAVRVWDRYGDYGIVGFVALRGNRLAECCFSCRSAGRGVERRVLAELARGGRLTADIVETERNAPIREIVKEFV